MYYPNHNSVTATDIVAGFFQRRVICVRQSEHLAPFPYRGDTVRIRLPLAKRRSLILNASPTPVPADRISTSTVTGQTSDGRSEVTDSSSAETSPSVIPASDNAIADQAMRNTDFRTDCRSELPRGPELQVGFLRKSYFSLSSDCRSTCG